MHLNEFADPKIYTLPAVDVAAVVNQLENIWLLRGLDDDSPLINHLTKEPENRRRKLIQVATRRD
jgi:hypothetical protein